MQQDGPMRWQSQEDRDHHAEVLNGEYGYGDIRIEYQDAPAFDHAAVRLSATEMDHLAQWWLIHRGWSIKPRGE